MKGSTVSYFAPPPPTPWKGVVAEQNKRGEGVCRPNRRVRQRCVPLVMYLLIHVKYCNFRYFHVLDFFSHVVMAVKRACPIMSRVFLQVWYTLVLLAYISGSAPNISRKHVGFGNL